jgi:hypothetical protein
MTSSASQALAGDRVSAPAGELAGRPVVKLIPYATLQPRDLAGGVLKAGELEK